MSKKSFGILGTLGAILIGVSCFVIFMLVIKNIPFAIGFGVAGYLAGLLIFAPRKKGLKVKLDGITQEDFDRILQDGYDKLDLMKSYTKRITDSKVKKKAAAICSIVEKILKDYEEDPIDLKTSKQFLSYYVDATLKILKKYIDISKHNLNSKEVKETLDKTELLLDKIHKAFEKQLAILLKNDILDLDVEMQVLEKTIDMEGLGETLDDEL